jgi:hypothetical protein
MGDGVSVGVAVGAGVDADIVDVPECDESAAGEPHAKRRTARNASEHRRISVANGARRSAVPR